MRAVDKLALATLSLVLSRANIWCPHIHEMGKENSGWDDSGNNRMILPLTGRVRPQPDGRPLKRGA